MTRSQTINITVTGIPPPPPPGGGLASIQGGTIGTYLGRSAVFVNSAQYVNVVVGTNPPQQQTLQAAAKLTGMIVISTITLQAQGVVSNPPPDLALIQGVTGNYYGSVSSDKIYQRDGVIGYNPDGSSVTGYAIISLQLGALTFASYSQLLSYLTAPPTPQQTTPSNVVLRYGGNTVKVHIVTGGSVFSKFGEKTVTYGTTPLAGATVHLTAVRSSSVTIPPILLPADVVGVTDQNGDFSFIITQDDPGYVGTTPSYGLYQITIEYGGILYGPFDYVDPNLPVTWTVDTVVGTGGG